MPISAAELAPDAKRVVLTAYADTDAAIAAINRSQVHYYLIKPWAPPEERLFPVLDDMLEDWRAGYRPGFGGLRVVDVSTPSAPAEVGFYDTPGDPWGVAVAGEYIYVVDQEAGLFVLALLQLQKAYLPLVAGGH